MYNLILNGKFLEAFMFIAAAVLSIMLHEIAHAFAAVKNGDLTPKYAGRLNLNPVRHFDPVGFGLFIFVGFGWAKPVPINPANFKNYRRGLFQVSAAGVTLNYLLAFVAYPLMALFYQNSLTNPVFGIIYYFFYFFYVINITLCVFNLIPVYPLDGFRLLEAGIGGYSPFLNFMYRYGSYIFIAFILLLNFSPLGTVFDFIRNIFGWPIRSIWGLFGV